MNLPSPGELLLGAWMRLTGKRHLVPLLKSLRHAGRPSEVPFPPELVEQGLTLVLAGLNNTLAMQSNASWVWPWWVERQTDPGSEAFLPTGTNVIQSNLTARNWTALGAEGSQREAMVDPVGMVTLRPYGWSWFPYVRADGADFFPPRLAGTRQELREDVLPVVRTLYAARPDLDWESEALALRAGAARDGSQDGSQEGSEWLVQTHRVRNRSDRALDLTFGIAVRPYNPLMFSPIASLAWADGVFRVNGKPALLLSDAPDRIAIANRRQGDPLLRADASSGDAARDSDSGMLTATAEYRLRLEPGEARELHVTGVIARGPAAPGAAVRPPSVADLRLSRDAELERLRADGARGMRIEVPHAELERAFRAVKARLHVFDDGDRFSPGSFLYHAHWFRDAAYIALAFDQMGEGDRVAAKLDASLRRQDWRGFFRSQTGEWDSNGQALWTIIGHVRRGGDPELLRRAWPALRRGGAWIDRKRRRGRGQPDAGLLPAGFSAEHFGPNDHYFWDNLWSVAGLEQLLWAARQLGKDGEAVRLERRIAEYRAGLDTAMRAAFGRARGAGLPCSPYRELDSAAVGNLVGLSPLYVTDPESEWVPGTVEFLARRNLRDGLFLQKIIHTGLNPYLSVQLARALLVRQDPRAFAILESLLRHGGPTFAWPEAIHPRTGGGCMGDGDHGWAAAEFLNLTRDLLVREERGALLLCSGAPEAWFREGATLAVEGAPTLHGTVAFRLTVGVDALALDWTCTRRAHQDPADLFLCLPLGRARALGLRGDAHGPHLRLRLRGDSGRMFHETVPPSGGDAAYSAPEGRILHA